MEMLEIFSFRSDEHVSHEKSVVGASTHNSNLDLILLVPSRKAVDDVDPVSCIKVIDGAFSIDSPDLLLKSM